MSLLLANVFTREMKWWWPQASSMASMVTVLIDHHLSLWFSCILYIIQTYIYIYVYIYIYICTIATSCPFECHFDAQKDAVVRTAQEFLRACGQCFSRWQEVIALLKLIWSPQLPTSLGPNKKGVDGRIWWFFCVKNGWCEQKKSAT